MIRAIYLFILIVFFCSCSQEKDCSYLQHYYQPVYLAEVAFYQGDFQKVYDILDKVSESCDLLDQRGIYELYKFSESAARIGKSERAVTLIRELLLRGYDIQQLANNEAFTPLLDSEGWKNLERAYDALHQEYLNSINLEIRAQVRDMVDADQHHRLLLNSTDNQDSLWQIINRTDSINDVKWKNIVRDYGYPDERLIGNYNVDYQHIDAGTLLFHFDDYDYYTETLLDLVDRGKAPPYSLGRFVDSYQRRVDAPKKFVFGIYDNTGEDQIIDYPNLDKRRMSIGLPPMALKRNIDNLRRQFYNMD